MNTSDYLVTYKINNKYDDSVGILDMYLLLQFKSNKDPWNEIFTYHCSIGKNNDIENEGLNRSKLQLLIHAIEDKKYQKITINYRYSTDKYDDKNCIIYDDDKINFIIKRNEDSNYNLVTKFNISFCINRSLIDVFKNILKELDNI